MPKYDDVEIPSMMLDQDEISERRGALDANKKKPSPNEEASQKDIESSAAPSKKINLLGIYIVLTLIFCAVVFAGYMFWSQNQALKAELQSQIRDLDSQLIAVDASANEKGLTIEETLKKHNSEIAKLWGVSYDRNRKAIQSNTDSVASFKKELSGLIKEQGEIDKQLSQQDKQQKTVIAEQKSLKDSLEKVTKVELVSMKKQLLDAQKETTSLVSKIEQQNKRIEDLLADLTSLESKSIESTAKLDAAEKNLKTVNNTLDGLENKINTQLGNSRPGDLEIQLSDHQEAIDSIDAYRKQVNNKLNRLEGHVNQLLLQSQIE